MILGYPEETLRSANGLATAREIRQQPATWRETLTMVEECRATIERFLLPLLSRGNLRVILTGAGTSAFAGRALAPYLSARLNGRFEAIATTDIVTDPGEYLAQDCPTLLISFARSGNSPESVAAVELASQLLSECHHLVLTCNGEGELYRRCQKDARSLALLMPPQTHDRSFAMTSSLTSMMLSCLAVFLPRQFNPIASQPLIALGDAILPQAELKVPEWDKPLPERVIYLGSGSLQGVAQEAALKLLELTAGQVMAMHDSPTGFRHGPKSAINRQTLIVLMVSNDPYTRQYDLDLLGELRQDGHAARVVALADRHHPAIEEGEHIYLPSPLNGDDAELALCYLLYAQYYAFHTALALGITPDNPCPSGRVNRVVQGVNIYPFNQQGGV
ncbi:SIS domain-containing protein [Aeromonas hydrophila]|uniref:SIS domain-containing protein n=1 Tax=Aeromonas hydrophila TaxID=644 RepID=UPI001A8CE5CF|nr:SIS domain-containing protein [Aeromonas hydrophila]MBQ4668097.1 SIS domain-containing protein [Aeromonas hydrophila]MBQ4716710.1 SIS domain-containing protein [Aeromonas hydrophila]MBW3825849.1 SIS domain-containing protein [Aeromonas hydrophila]MBW5271026.1 SIS domain-containing protein [Aeromonas hydrophila]QSR53099.1 SIS domain-containing protein [Aeromonas hydrophila]